MGCSFSCKSSSSVVVSQQRIIRVVHLNGYIEDFDRPVTVCEVTRNSSKHFVCTQFQLLSACSKPLLPDTLLKSGEFYFLLPFSVFQSTVSPEEFVLVAKKLINIAKTKRSISENNTNSSFRLVDGTLTTSPSLRSPDEPETGIMRKSTKSQSSWKPILATIREISFNRRSESDLQEKSKQVV